MFDSPAVIKDLNSNMITSKTFCKYLELNELSRVNSISLVRTSRKNEVEGKEIAERPDFLQC